MANEYLQMFKIISYNQNKNEQHYEMLPHTQKNI